jgi:hypothetical protein
MADLDVPRYKYMVQVVMGEQKGEGIQIGSRFFWDSDTDKFATESFSNVSVRGLPQCAVVVYVFSGFVVAGPAVLCCDRIRRVSILATFSIWLSDVQ